MRSEYIAFSIYLYYFILHFQKYLLITYILLVRIKSIRERRKLFILNKKTKKCHKKDNKLVELWHFCCYNKNKSTIFLHKSYKNYIM